MVKIGCIGSGYWGKNLVRVFYQLGNLVACCDRNNELLDNIKRSYRGVSVTSDVKDLLSNPDIDAVAIATPSSSHYKIAKEALEAGKHVYVEKPLTLSVSHTEELVEMAKEKNLILMVGHLLLYHNAVLKLKELIVKGELGDIYYVYSHRGNLGQVRSDENALWGLATHDISVILFLLDQSPVSVSAMGACYIQLDAGIEDVVFLNLRFGDGKIVNIHVSWLDPHKIRSTTIVGSKKMVVFDDVAATEKIKIYDTGVECKYSAQNYESYGDALTLRSGDIFIPKVDMMEPLKAECKHFIDSVENGVVPRSDGLNALNVIRVLEAAQKSLNCGGIPVEIKNS